MHQNPQATEKYNVDTFCTVLQSQKGIVLNPVLQHFTLRMFWLVSMKGLCLKNPLFIQELE